MALGFNELGVRQEHFFKLPLSEGDFFESQSRTQVIIQWGFQSRNHVTYEETEACSHSVTDGCPLDWHLPFCSSQS